MGHHAHEERVEGGIAGRAAPTSPADELDEDVDVVAPCSVATEEADVEVVVVAAWLGRFDAQQPSRPGGLLGRTAAERAH